MNWQDLVLTANFPAEISCEEISRSETRITLLLKGRSLNSARAALCFIDLLELLTPRTSIPGGIYWENSAFGASARVSLEGGSSVAALCKVINFSPHGVCRAAPAAGRRPRHSRCPAPSAPLHARPHRKSSFRIPRSLSAKDAGISSRLHYTESD